ncbi:MAG TPA: LCP family protein [Baekduia sp.]|nr:LCP family protein [Baekduia sp.]
MKRYRAAPSLRRRPDDQLAMLKELRDERMRSEQGKALPQLRPGRVIKWAAIAVLSWLALSLVLFLVSAQLRQGDVSGQLGGVLGHPGYPLVSPNTILVLGSDQRSEATAEPGSTTSGPSRSDSIMLMRVGGGKSARLAIPRDTVVDIPGHGRDKINAAFAIGGAPLAIQTVSNFLDIKIDHVVQVDFDNFPELIDSMGGITYSGGCVISRINGGYKNGGITLRLKKGKSHLNGKQALALARTRKNECNPAENDITRARRQQKIFAAMKSRLVSPGAFIRLPWVAWNAPKALRTDMNGPTLLGLFGAIAAGGNAPTEVLRPSGAVTLPNGGAALTVSDADKSEAVRKFLDG